MRFVSKIEALVAVLLLAPASYAAIIGGTNLSNVTIPDAGPFVSSPIEVSGVPSGAVVTNIDVYFRCIHPYAGDLVVELRADPQRTNGFRTLWNFEGASAPNPMRTVSRISTFNGLAVNRTWYLAARDAILGDNGYIDEWTITIYYTSPSVPGSFSLSSSSTLCDRTNAPVPAMHLTWTASTGDLITYQVFRNGNPIGSQTTGLTFYDKDGLTPGLTYSYYVQASNPGGSTNSPAINATIPADVCGTPPGNFSLSNDTPLCDQSGSPTPAVELNWTAASGVGVMYQVFRNSNPIGQATSGLTYYDNAGLSAGQTYNYIVRATNAGGTTFSSSVIVPIAVDICWPTTNTTRALGINVSADRGVIDWSRVRVAGKTFTVVRATDGRRQAGQMTVDTRFSANMTAAMQAGLLVAPFHFARPHVNSALDEAQHFLSVSGNYISPGYLPPAVMILDPEDETPGVVSGLGKVVLSGWIRDWCAEIVRVKGVKPVLYTRVSFAQNLMESDLAQYRLWVANYTIPPAAPMSPDANPSNLGPWNSSWSFMQYAILGTAVDGVPNSPVQLDVFNGNTNELRRFVIPLISLNGVDGGALQPPIGGQFRFQVNASLPQVTVQASEDMVDWLDIGPLTIVNGKGVFTDSAAGLHSKRLYRVKP